MEYGVILSDLTESEIKPRELVGVYRDKVLADNLKFFPAKDLHKISCPACGSNATDKNFKKSSLEYQQCASCWSLYVSPRPPQKTIEEYYRSSEARRYWHSEIWAHTKKQRLTKIYEPLLHWIENFLLDSEGSSGNPLVAELFASNWGWMETWNHHNGKNPLREVSPLFDESLCPLTGWAEHRLTLDTVQKFDAVCVLDALARVEDPQKLFQWVASHLKPGGVCFVTTLLSSGIDLLTLQEKAEFLIPPDHLNVFSFEGIQQVIKGMPFEIAEFSTPGVLDLQNIEDTLRLDDSSIPDFFKYVLKVRKDPALVQSFQEFLQLNRLSSQGRLVLRRK